MNHKARSRAERPDGLMEVVSNARAAPRFLISNWGSEVNDTVSVCRTSPDIFQNHLMTFKLTLCLGTGRLSDVGRSECERFGRICAGSKLPAFSSSRFGVVGSWEVLELVLDPHDLISLLQLPESFVKVVLPSSKIILNLRVSIYLL